MARKPELAELTTRLALQALGSEGRHKRILLFGGIGVVLLGVGVFVTARTIDARDTSAREESFGALSTCLLGADPLKADEKASARVANVKLGVAGITLDKRGVKAGELGWPGSCSTHAYQIKEHAGDTPLAAAAEALGKALRADASATADLQKEIDQVWAEATNAKLVAKPPPSGTPAVTPAPKAAVPTFTAEQFRALPKVLSTTFSLANIREEPMPGGRIHFLVDQKDMPEGPVLCTVSATEAAIKCMKAPAQVATLSPGLRLVGTTDDGARPFYFAGDRGQLGIFPPDGKHAIAAAVAVGASARADGSIAFAARKEGAKDIRFIHQPAVGPTHELPMLQPTEFDAPSHMTLGWDWFIHRSLAKQGSPSHLWARKIEGSMVKPAVDIGEIDEQAPMDKAERDNAQVTICKSEEAIAVRVRGQRTDAISFYAGGRWSAPVKAPTHGGSFTCRGLEAVATTVDHTPGDKDYPVITQAKCNTSGCTTTKVDMRTMLTGIGEIAPADPTSSVAADIGGKLMLVWNGGLVGGLRMRFAPADKFKEAEDVIITDGRDEKSTVSSIAQIKVLGANGQAVLLLSTTSGVKALRVDASGKVTPLATSL